MSYPTYEPSNEVLEGVEYCQDYGAPARVEYYDVGADAAASASEDYREVWFTSSTGTQYRSSESGVIDYPQVCIAEMGSEPLMMLRGQPNGDYGTTPKPPEPDSNPEPPNQAPP